MVGAVDETTDVLCTSACKRTVKFLLALSRGIPVVDASWIQSSEEAGKWRDPNSHLLKDPSNEEALGFSLEESLVKARDRSTPLFAGMSFYVAAGTHIPREELSRIIKVAGGAIVATMPRSKRKDDLYAVCPADIKASAKKTLEQKGMMCLEAEAVLRSICQQDLSPISEK